jgi:hypothetical protein
MFAAAANEEVADSEAADNSSSDRLEEDNDSYNVAEDVDGNSSIEDDIIDLTWVSRDFGVTLDYRDASIRIRTSFSFFPHVACFLNSL